MPYRTLGALLLGLASGLLPASAADHGALPPATPAALGPTRPSDLCSRLTPGAQRVTTGAPVSSAEDQALLAAARGQLGLAVGPCTSADFAQLTGQALVDAIATADACLEVLWSFDASVAATVRPGNVGLVAAAAQAEALSLAANADRLRNLTYFLQIAYYHEWFQPTVTYSPALDAQAQQAVVAIAASPDFLLETLPVADLRLQWAATMDGVNATHLVLGAVESLLQRYATQPALKQDYDERFLTYRLFFSIARQVGNFDNDLGAASPWVGAVQPSLLSQIQPIALDLGYTPDSEYVTLNALWALANLSVLDAPTALAAHQQVSSAYLSFPTYSGPWFRAVTDLGTFWSATLSDGTVLDIPQIQQAVEAIALPHTYTFDQGALVFRTAISLGDAEDLYDALNETESQFFRRTTHLDPVTGDTNDVLTLVIYASPDDYALYQPFLYGLSTDNGGIYIEGSGTLFTYDRTPAQSIYTLEELLRHEYTHFLDGRYLVQGGWYEAGGLYEGGRLDTYGEGLAEYMVGARRTDGILTRGTLLSSISGDPNPMTIAEILNATYATGGFSFYPYAGLFMRFLEVQHPDLQAALFDTIRANDAAAVDALYAQLAGDAALQADYAGFLAASQLAWSQGTAVFAEDVATALTPAGLPADNAAAVRQVLQSQAPTAGGDFLVWKQRYRYEDQLTLTVPAGSTEAQVRELFDTAMDAALVSLLPQGVNFQTPVAWFGDVSWAGTSATATYVLEGPYNATAGDTQPPAVPAGVLADGGVGSVVLSWAANTEADLAGYRVYRAGTSGGPYTPLSPTILQDATFTDGDLTVGLRYYVVTATDASGNESAHSPEVAAGPAVGTRALVVNGYFDGANPSFVDAYTSELTALGISFDVWDPFVDGEVTPAVLAPYVDGMVIWPVGYYQSGSATQLSQARRDTIKGYLDLGGRLVFSGAYMSSSLDGTPLFTSYFHAQHVNSVADLATLNGQPQSPAGWGLTLGLTYAGYGSEVDVTAPAVPAFVYQPGSGPGSIQSSGTAGFTVDDGYRVAYLAFPFSYLAAPDRTALMERLVDWMLPTISVAPGLAGATNTVRVVGAEPGELVLLFAGTQHGSIPTFCPGGYTLGISDAFVLAVVPADSEGIADLAVPVPAALSGFSFLLQGGLVTSCSLTETLVETF